MKPVMLVIIALLLSTSAFAAHWYKSPFEFERRIGVERVTHHDYRVQRSLGRIDTTVYLDPINADLLGKGVGRGGYNPIYPRGTATIRSTSLYGFPRAQAFIKVKDLRPSSETKMQYEAWLVDQDTDYRLSLGTFTTVFGGTGLLTYQIDNFFDAYDYVEITEEPFYDPDPSHGPTVLLGSIHKQNYYAPTPKQAKLVTSVFEESKNE
jgi:hypothetical protein